MIAAKTIQSTLLGVLLAACIAAASPANEAAIQRWEKWIETPPQPSQIPEIAAELQRNKPPDSDARALSTWYRTKAFLKAQLPKHDRAAIHQLLDRAIQTAGNIQGDTEPLRRALLNKAAVARSIMETELQQAVLYGIKQDAFFRLMADSYQPAKHAIARGHNLATTPRDRADFLIAESSLTYTFALTAQTFSRNRSLPEKLYQKSANKAQRVLDLLSRHNIDDPALYRTALNNLAITAIRTDAPEQKRLRLIDKLRAQAGKKNTSFETKTASLSTAIELARHQTTSQQQKRRLREVTQAAIPVFNDLLNNQKKLASLSRSGGTASPLFDAYSHFISTLVLGLLDAGNTAEALQIVRRSKWSTLAPLIAPPENGLEALRERLQKRNAILIEQFLSHEGLIQFIIEDGASIRVHRADKDAHATASLIAKYHKKIGSASPIRLLLRGRKRLFLENLERGRELYQTLMLDAGIDDYYQQVDEILVAPHLLLSYLSYASLPVDINSNDPLATQYLCETAPPISQIPSSLILSSEKTRTWNTPIHYFARSDFQEQTPTYGSDLPGVLQEVANCRSVLEGPALFEADATESAFWKRAADARVLYLASHGIADRKNPMNSRILLAETNAQKPAQDGYVKVKELLQAGTGGPRPPIRPKLAVLSACVTALSENRPMYSDGLASLARAMLASGSQQVIGTLWDAHDKTYSMMMPAMLEHFDRNGRPAAALWRAQSNRLKQLKNRTNTSPLAAPMFWASAVCFSRL